MIKSKVTIMICIQHNRLSLTWHRGPDCKRLNKKKGVPNSSGRPFLFFYEFTDYAATSFLTDTATLNKIVSIRKPAHHTPAVMISSGIEGIYSFT